MFIASSFIIGNSENTPINCPLIDEWVADMIYTGNGIVSSYKKGLMKNNCYWDDENIVQ